MWTFEEVVDVWNYLVCWLFAHCVLAHAGGNGAGLIFVTVGIVVDTAYSVDLHVLGFGCLMGMVDAYNELNDGG